MLEGKGVLQAGRVQLAFEVWGNKDPPECKVLHLLDTHEGCCKSFLILTCSLQWDLQSAGHTLHPQAPNKIQDKWLSTWTQVHCSPSGCSITVICTKHSTSFLFIDFIYLSLSNLTFALNINSIFSRKICISLSRIYTFMYTKFHHKLIWVGTFKNLLQWKLCF